MSKVTFKKVHFYFETKGDFMMDAVALRLWKHETKWNLTFKKQGDLTFKLFAAFTLKRDAVSSAKRHFEF